MAVETVAGASANGPHTLVVMTIALTMSDISSVDAAERARCSREFAPITLALSIIADSFDTRSLTMGLILPYEEYCRRHCC